MQMEEAFQMFLAKKQSETQEDLDIARKCFEMMTGNIIFGPYFLEKCNSNESNEYINAILCFKSWIYNFWSNALNFDQKQNIIKSLIQLIKSNKNLTLCILDIFTIIIQNDEEILDSFHGFIQIILQNINLNEMQILKNLLLFLKKLFSLSKNKEFYYLLYKQQLHHLFTNQSLLQINENFPFKVYDYLIKCFSSLFFEINDNMNDIIQPIEFSKYILSSCNDTCLVSRCSKFFMKCILHKKTQAFFAPITNEILLLHMNNIARFIQKGDDYVVYHFLRVIHHINIVPECFEILKSAACLTRENISDFYSNPFVFYSIIYSSSAFKYGPRGFAIIAIDTLFQNYPDMIQNLANLEINELSMRIFGFLSTLNIVRKPIFNQIRMNFINSMLQVQFNDPISIATKIYLISKSTDLFDSTFLIKLFLTYFESTNDVIRILLCKIACKMKFFTPEIPHLILCFLPTCQNHSAFKALNQIALKQPQIMINEANPIILLNKLSIQKEFEDDEIDEGKISCNLESLNIFVQQFLRMFQPNEIVMLINQLISYDSYEDDTIYKCTSNFLIRIFRECPDDIDNILSKSIMKCMLDNLYNSTQKEIFLEYFGVVFLFVISNNRNMFLNLGVSSSLICFCLEILKFDQSPILIACDIISFIVQIDKTLDITVLIKYSDYYLNQENKNSLYILGYSNILSSIIVSGHNFSQINPNIFLCIIDKKYYIRIYDKHLTAAALTCYQNETLINAAKILYQQEINQKNMSKNDYDRYIDTLDLPISIVESNNDYFFQAPIQEIKLFE